jgi:uncharacterized protein involved in exopolysaccharide biosynthesis
MADSDQDRQARAGRGSLLDLASRTPDGARVSAYGLRKGAEPRREEPSFPGSQAGTPRLSTRRSSHTDGESVKATGEGYSGRPGDAPDLPPGAGKKSFGRHIASLLVDPGDEAAQAGRTPKAGSEDNAVSGVTHQVAEPRDEEFAAGYWRNENARAPLRDGGEDQPLIDIGVLIASVWRFRRLIIAMTVLGAVGGVAVALSTPHRYYAENRIFVDPREIRLTDDDLRNQLLSTEAMIAMTDSQVEILSSNNVLSKVVDNLNLTRDPEYNGSANSGGILGGIALLRQLVSGTEANRATEIEAIESLREALHVSRDPKTFVINVGIVSRDAEKSALIANTVVQTYLDSEGAAQSGLMEKTSEAIDSRLEALRADLNAAERAVENFRAENDLVGVGGELIDDKQVLALNQQLANARAQKVAVRVKAENLAKADVSDIIDGAFPEEFLSANLIELRKQFAQTKTNTDSLASRFGPRHPQYLAASSSLESMRGQIRAELRRIVASSQAELQRAIETEQELASQLAVAKTKSLDNSEELVTLRELERKAAATRQIYEGFLKRSRETSERGNLNTQNVRVISSAEPPLQPYGPSRKIVVILGTVLGALAGIAIALAFGLFRIVGQFLPEGGPDGSGKPRRPAPSAPVSPYPRAIRNTETGREVHPAFAEPVRTRAFSQPETPVSAAPATVAPATAVEEPVRDEGAAPTPQLRPESAPPASSEVKSTEPAPAPVSQPPQAQEPAHQAPWPQPPVSAWPSPPPYWQQQQSGPAPWAPGYQQPAAYPYAPHHSYPPATPQLQAGAWPWAHPGYAPYPPASPVASYPAPQMPYPQAAQPQQPSSDQDRPAREDRSAAEIERLRAEMHDLRQRIDRTGRRRRSA